MLLSTRKLILPSLQGAHVVGDILGGGGGSFQGCTQRTVQGLNPTTSPGNKIKAALLWGDVRHTANQAYNTNTGASRTGVSIFCVATMVLVSVHPD